MCVGGGREGGGVLCFYLFIFIYLVFLREYELYYVFVYGGFIYIYIYIYYVTLHTYIHTYIHTFIIIVVVIQNYF